jgi:metal-dependent amidase/aminoacylase/carboxypeptidase family protein
MKSKLNDIKTFVADWNRENTIPFYEVADQLWNNPELSMQEYESSGAMMKY